MGLEFIVAAAVADDGSVVYGAGRSENRVTIYFCSEMGWLFDAGLRTGLDSRHPCTGTTATRIDQSLKAPTQSERRESRQAGRQTRTGQRSGVRQTDSLTLSNRGDKIEKKDCDWRRKREQGLTGKYQGRSILSRGLAR